MSVPKWMLPEKPVLSWALFEAGYWGAMALTAQSLIPYLLKNSLGEMAVHAPILWGFVVAGATILGVFSCPIFGAIADWTETRKFQIFIFMSIAILASFGFLVFLDNWLFASMLAAACILPSVVALTLFNSLLVFLAQSEKDLSRASTLATTLGSIGPAVFLTAINFPALVPETMALPELFLLFFTAGLWWIVFSIPLFLAVPEFKSHQDVPSLSSQMEEAKQLVRKTAKNKNLLLLLGGLFCFGDSSSAMFHLSLVFAASIGIDSQNLFGAVLLNKWLCVGMSLVWSLVARIVTPKIGLFIVMSIMFAATLNAFVMTTPAEFWCLQIALSAVSTGSFIFCRVLLASVTPMDKAGFHFGFLGAVGNLSGFFGPLLFSVFGLITGDAKDGFLFLSFLTLVAAYLFYLVDFDLAKLAAQSDPIPDETKS